MTTDMLRRTGTPFDAHVASIINFAGLNPALVQECPTPDQHIRVLYAQICMLSALGVQSVDEARLAFKHPTIPDEYRDVMPMVFGAEVRVTWQGVSNGPPGWDLYLLGEDATAPSDMVLRASVSGEIVTKLV